ncbi:MAG: DUF1015 domain-containing protein [Oscillospiraceae bacterium]|nr:DUF1015 domain-containing protein [Oscillospiraceae bacterium]
MAVLRPFKAIRPTNEMAEKVGALPYDVMNSYEAREMVKGNPYSFLHIDKAEIDLPKDTYIYDEKVYEKAKENLEKLITDGVLVQDSKPMLYIYRQIMNGRAQTGLVGCTAVDDYINNVIKKHEFTRSDKEADRIHHVDTCNANTGPIFLTHRENETVSEIIKSWTNSHEPVYDFVSEDGVGQIVWVIDDDSTVQTLVAEYAKIPYLYIADGHHRCASAVKVGEKRRANGEYDKTAEFNFFLSVIFPCNELKIMDYNRVIADLNGFTKEEFINKISEKFTVEKVGKEPYAPSIRHTFGMFLDGEWYCLSAKQEYINENDPVECLDVSILQNNLISPVLGINDPRTDKRIDFVGGIRGLSELERRVNEGMKVAFSMYPTSLSELMNIADAGKVMPPKSTWFEPKLLSGLFIHKLSD